MKITTIILIGAALPALAADFQFKDTGYATDADLSVRVAAVDQLYTEALSPRPEDQSIDPNDPYVKGWPEIFGPEGVRKARFERARKFADEVRVAVAEDSRKLREAKLHQAILENEVALDTESKRAKLELEVTRERSKITEEIIKAVHDEKDVEVTVQPGGAIVIKKGRIQPAPTIIR